jgi:GT2 family glycosyltransferase
LIVVDNGSTDSSIEIVRSCGLSNIQIIENNSNLGFAEGMNIGIEKAQGELIIPLNLDVVLSDNYLQVCADVFFYMPDIGMLGGIELAWDNGVLTDKVVSQGGFFLRRRIQGITNITKESGYCFGPHGSFPCIRAVAMRESKTIYGYFYDPKFETGWEDMDLWFRLHRLGWNCYFKKELIAWHVGSASAEAKKKLIEKNLEYQKRIFRNRYYLIIKNITGKLAIRLFPFIAVAELLIIPYYLFVSPLSVKALFSAWIQIMQQFPKLMQERRRLRRTIKIKKKLNKLFYGV